MGSKYYDEWEFIQATNCIENKPFIAKQRLEEYLKNYPKDYRAYSYYASILIMLNNFAEAEKMLKKTEDLMKQDSRFTNSLGKVKMLKRLIFFDRLRILSYTEKYRELYSTLQNSVMELGEDKNMGLVMFLCKHRLGMLNQAREAGHSYIFRQIIKYDEDDFWDHIQKHLADYNSNLDEPNKNIFVPCFPINEVVKEILNNMSEDNKLCCGFYDDTYIFKYDECGRVDNKLVNYIKVICFHNTKDIITVLPIEYGEDMPHVDLNYMKKETSTEIKRESAIEKFNKRFKR